MVQQVYDDREQSESLRRIPMKLLLLLEPIVLRSSLLTTMKEDWEQYERRRDDGIRVGIFKPACSHGLPLRIHVATPAKFTELPFRGDKKEKILTKNKI